MTDGPPTDSKALDYIGVGVTGLFSGIYGLVAAGVRASTPGRSAQAFLATYELMRATTTSFAFADNEPVEARTVESVIIGTGSVAAGAVAGLALTVAGVSASSILLPAAIIGTASFFCGRRT